MVLPVPPNIELFHRAQEKQDDSELDEVSQWQLFKRLVKPLHRLRRLELKDVFLEPGVGSERNPVPVNDYESEGILEKHVMGDTYNSMDRGK